MPPGSHLLPEPCQTLFFELPLPVEIEEKLQAGQRVYLKFDEYFKLDEYGNMIWQLERLSGLELELKTE